MESQTKNGRKEWAWSFGVYSFNVTVSMPGTVMAFGHSNRCAMGVAAAAAVDTFCAVNVRPIGRVPF